MTDAELLAKRQEWNQYEYGHKKVIRELGINESDLPVKIRETIRGLNLGLSRIKDEAGFHKLVTLGAAIGDSIITWHEQGIQKTEEQHMLEEQEKRNQEAEAEKKKKQEAEDLAEKQRLADLEAEKRIKHHTNPAGENDKDKHNSDSGSVFFWD